MVFKKGDMPWNKNLTKETSEKVKQNGRNVSKARKKLFREGKIKIWNKGIPRSEKTKKKMSKSKKGKEYPKISQALKGKHVSPKTEFKKGHTLQNHIKETNPKKFEEWRKKQSTAHKGKNNPMFGMRLEKSPVWRGGISFEPYNPEFNNRLKKQIRQRDNFTCQECNFTQEQLGRKLDVHHIDFNKQNNHPNNLISLCRSCHAQTYFNRNDWTNYFQNKIEGLKCH